MGTHNYVLQAFGKRKEESPPTERSISFYRYSRDASGEVESIIFTMEEWEDLLEIERETRYIEEFSCRELLLNDTNTWEEIFTYQNNKNANYMVAVKCTGEMYTTTSKFLVKKQARENFCRIIKDSLGLSITLQAGNLSKNESKYMTPIKLKDSQRKINGRIVIFLRSWENLGNDNIGVKVSAVLAILKEPRIISKIANGSIFDTRTLCKELLKIARDRINMEDNSYYCITLSQLYPSYFFTKLEMMEKIKNELDLPFNDDGSDWASIFLLSAYFSEPDDCTVSSNGPVNSVLSRNLGKRFFLKYRQFVDEDKILQEIYKECVYRLEYLHEEDADEQFLEDFYHTIKEGLALWETK